ncbi:MAG: alpha/beta hydrolase [Candidatus Omnitrophota bacterium]
MIIRLLFLIVLLITTLVFGIKYIETRGIFYPARDITCYPSDLGMPFEDIYVKTKDGVTINGWFIPQKSARYTLLFFHGNAGNIQHRLDKLLILRETGANIFIIDYRGFGKSSGRLMEEGFYLDADSACKYLTKARGISPEEVILYGESLGTAVAIDLASRTKVAAVMLEGAFSSGRDMAKKIYPFLPVFIFAKKFDSLKKINGVTAPKLFIHSINDEMVPFAFAGKLYQAAPAPKELVELTGGHNTAFLDSREKYISSISGFIRRLHEGKDLLPSH